MTLFEPLTGKITKPINQKIGKVLGGNEPIHESTIRNWQRNNSEYFEERLLQYRTMKSPFITDTDFKKMHPTSEHITFDAIVNKSIPGILDKENNVLVPVNLEDILKYIDEIRSFGDSNVVSIANFKGGVGKTTTAVNVSTILSFYGFNVLVVDFDIQGNTTSMFDIYRYKKNPNKKPDLSIVDLEQIYDWERSDFRYSIIDMLCEIENDNIESLIRENIVSLNDRVKVRGKLDILPNDSSIENALKFEDIGTKLKTYGNINQVLDEVLGHVKSDYDFVIIDTPPSIKLDLRMAVLATDYFIIALTPDRMAKDGIASFIVPIEMNSKSYRKLKGKDVVILGGIMNQYQSGIRVQRLNKDLIEEELINTVMNSDLGETTLFKQFIKVDNVLKESQTDMGAVLLYDPTNELVRDYFNLVDEILEKILIDKYSKAE